MMKEFLSQLASKYPNVTFDFERSLIPTLKLDGSDFLYIDTNRDFKEHKSLTESIKNCGYKIYTPFILMNAMDFVSQANSARALYKRNEDGSFVQIRLADVTPNMWVLIDGQHRKASIDALNKIRPNTITHIPINIVKANEVNSDVDEFIIAINTNTSNWNFRDFLKQSLTSHFDLPSKKMRDILDCISTAYNEWGMAMSTIGRLFCDDRGYITNDRFIDFYKHNVQMDKFDISKGKTRYAMLKDLGFSYTQLKTRYLYDYIHFYEKHGTSLTSILKRLKTDISRMGVDATYNKIKRDCVDIIKNFHETKD